MSLSAQRCVSVFFGSLLCLAFAASSVQAKVLHDIDFGVTDGRVDASGMNPKASGTLPEGVREDSGWANIRVNYERQEDALGGGLSWTRVEVSDHKTGRAQLKFELPANSGESLYRLSYILGSPSSNPVKFVIRDTMAPYTTHFEETIGLEPSRRIEYVDFIIPPLEQDISAFLEFGQFGTYDVFSIKLESKTMEDLKAEAQEKYPDGGPANLLRQTHFPFGLPFGWGERSGHTHAWHTTRAPEWEAGEATGTVPLRVVSKQKKWRPFTIATAPFPIAVPHETHTASLFIRGTSSGNLKVVTDGQTLGSKDFEIKDATTWQRLEVSFEPKLISKYNVLVFEGEGDYEIAGFMVAPGETAGEFRRAKPAELQLTADYMRGDMFIEGVEQEPVIRYAVSQVSQAGATLHLTVFNAYGESVDLSPIPLEASPLQKGEVKVGFPFEAGPYGPFRVEGKVVYSGRVVSNPAELVYYWLRKPNYYSEFHPESRFGLHFNTLEPSANAARAIGAKWLRLHGPQGHITYWTGVEREKGEFKFNDRDLDFMRDRYLSILGVLVETPYWARIERRNKGAQAYQDRWWQPQYLEDYTNYVSRIVGHYKGVVDDWQIWNEPWGHFMFKDWRPELRGFDRWHRGETPEEDYIKIEKAAYEAAKEANPEVNIVGMHGTLGSKGEGWVEQMVKLGQGKYFDVASYHGYRIGLGDDMLDPEKSYLLQRMESQIFTPMREGGLDPDETEIWMTEGKASDSKPDTGFLKLTLGLDEPDLDAAELNGAALVNYHLSKFAAGVDKVFIYIMGDTNFWKPGTGIYWHVMTLPGNKFTVSTSIYAAMTYHLEDTDFVSKEKVADGVYAFTFEKTRSRGEFTAGDRITVYSSELSAASYELSVKGEIRDIYGNEFEDLTLPAGRLAYVIDRAARGEVVDESVVDSELDSDRAPEGALVSGEEKSDAPDRTILYLSLLFVGALGFLFLLISGAKRK